MGARKSSSQQTQQSSNTVSYQPKSLQEQQLLNRIAGLGGTQTDYLTGLLNGTTSPFALNQQDQNQLDQAYNSAFQRFNTQGKDYADYLATTRGLNKSDTPIAQTALDRYGQGMSDLLSQRANAGLQMGLQGTGLRLGATGGVPGGLGMAYQGLQGERLAAPTTQGSGTTTINTRYQPSLMDNIGQGMGLGMQGLQLGGMLLGPLAGLGGAGGGAGMLGGKSLGGMMPGMSANSWFPSSAGV